MVTFKDPRYTEHYNPKAIKRKRFNLPRKRKKLLRRYPWYEAPVVHDIDLMKFENLHGGFCGCGARVTEVCTRCLNEADM